MEFAIQPEFPEQRPIPRIKESHIEYRKAEIIYHYKIQPKDKEYDTVELGKRAYEELKRFRGEFITPKRPKDKEVVFFMKHCLHKGAYRRGPKWIKWLREGAGNSKYDEYFAKAKKELWRRRRAMRFYGRRTFRF